MININFDLPYFLKNVAIILQADQFKNIIRELAEMENVSEDNIFLSLREKNIVSFDTPVSIKLTVADIIGKL